MRGLVWLFTEPDRKLTAAAMTPAAYAGDARPPGAGFAIAARDLDMRGAGDLLGEDQAGHLRLIGLELYQHLLVMRVAGSGGGASGDRNGCRKWRWASPRHLPPEYVPDEAVRIALHMRLARLEEPGALAEELEDRFGPPPPAVISLLMITRLRRACRRLGVARLEGGPAAVAARFRGAPPHVPGLERTGDRLLLRHASRTASERLNIATTLLRMLRDKTEPIVAA